MSYWDLYWPVSMRGRGYAPTLFLLGREGDEMGPLGAVKSPSDWYEAPYDEEWFDECIYPGTSLSGEDLLRNKEKDRL